MNFLLEYLKLDFCILFLILSGKFNGYYISYPYSDLTIVLLLLYDMQ